MNLPIQAPPSLRNVSTAKLSQIRGIDPSMVITRNPQLQCDICCQLGGGNLCSNMIPGCICP